MDNGQGRGEDWRETTTKRNNNYAQAVHPNTRGNVTLPNCSQVILQHCDNIVYSSSSPKTKTKSLTWNRRGRDRRGGVVESVVVVGGGGREPN